MILWYADIDQTWQIERKFSCSWALSAISNDAGDRVFLSTGDAFGTTGTIFSLKGEILARVNIPKDYSLLGMDSKGNIRTERNETKTLPDGHEEVEDESSKGLLKPSDCLMTSKHLLRRFDYALLDYDFGKQTFRSYTIGQYDAYCVSPSSNTIFVLDANVPMTLLEHVRPGPSIKHDVRSASGGELTRLGDKSIAATSDGRVFCFALATAFTDTELERLETISEPGSEKDVKYALVAITIKTGRAEPVVLFQQKDEQGYILWDKIKRLVSLENGTKVGVLFSGSFYVISKKPAHE